MANNYRNPWGKGKKGNWEGPWSDGSKEFTAEMQLELNHKFGSDSVFWISYQDLLRKYQHFDRTRLFMDSPDWRITQKWVSAEVPWKPRFEQKFRIVLTTESSVVLVLSQLDDRFFEGLQGQYTFRLQFRLHEVGSLDENDYIVRSHGNYLMERSVVTELKSLPAGTYSVFVMVVADRDTFTPSVEDVVKAQTRRRIDNDKLAQVGKSYDIAHSKGSAYAKSKEATRKAFDKVRARETRIATRKKNWEMRHLSREIMRKQDVKNQEKRKRKETKDSAQAKEKQDKAPKDQAIQTEEVKDVVLQTEDKSVQTEDQAPSTTEPAETILPPNSEINILKDTDKAVQTDDLSSASGSEASSTPKTPNSSTVAGWSPPVRVSIRGPPPPPSGTPRHYPGARPDYAGARPGSERRHYSRGPPPPPPRQQQYIESDGESSASPISDFDDMYSDDDPTLKPRPVNNPTPPGVKPKGNDSDDEDEADPWNAVCIVGFRVYSKDEGLELMIYDETLENKGGGVELVVEKKKASVEGELVVGQKKEDEVNVQAVTGGENSEKQGEVAVPVQS